MITKRNALFDEVAQRITVQQAAEIDRLLDSGYSPLVDVSAPEADTDQEKKINC